MELNNFDPAQWSGQSCHQVHSAAILGGGDTADQNNTLSEIIKSTMKILKELSCHRMTSNATFFDINRPDEVTMAPVLK
jgi:hypothetical protein